MISCRYERRTGRPYVDGYVQIPRLSIEGAVSFLLDTGADRTVLMPADYVRLGVPYRSLSGASTTIGVGGSARAFEEDASVIFVDDGEVLHAYDVRIMLMRRKEALLNVPSLLGRDIFNRWSIRLDHPAGVIEVNVRSSDRRFAEQ